MQPGVLWIVTRLHNREERQRLGESHAVRACVVSASAIFYQEIRVADFCAGYAAADLGTGLLLGLTPVEL